MQMCPPQMFSWSFLDTRFTFAFHSSSSVDVLLELLYHAVGQVEPVLPADDLHIL